jgi:acyl carrier protein
MEQVLNLVLETVKEIGEDQNNQVLMDATEDTRLFGENLDSMGIVFLVTDLESRISDELDIDLTLADERAMSQKTSPFRSVKTLAKYVSTLIDDAKAV